MRSPLTPTIKRVEGMIDYVRENLDDGEYDLFLDLLVPEPELVVKPAKKTRKKRSTKSSHQQSLSSAIQKVGKGRVGDNGDENERCTVIRGDLGGTVCGLLSDHNVHQMTSARGYHPFVSGSDVVSVGGQSSVNGAAASSAASTEIKQDAVSTAGTTSDY